MRIVAPVAGVLFYLAIGPASGSQLPADFVFLRDVDPSIGQDVKYAGPDNFMGGKLPGYDAAECVLRKPVADALKRVQRHLLRQGFSLKVYDCYRPERAVRVMTRWAADGRSPDDPTKRFFPRLEKRNLVAYGYIGERSSHSTGTAVDLTMMIPNTAAHPFDPAARYGPCTAPAGERAPDNSVDMGTGFDCFDGKSHTASAEIAPGQRRSRLVLRDVMATYGFANYHREWWPFTYPLPGRKDYFDFPIPPRNEPKS